MGNIFSKKPCMKPSSLCACSCSTTSSCSCSNNQNIVKEEKEEKKEKEVVNESSICGRSRIFIKGA